MPSQELSTTFHPIYYSQATLLAQQGFTNKQIAEQLKPPVKFTAFLSWTRKDPTFKAAIEQGKQFATEKTPYQSLQDQADKLTTTQMTFLMAFSQCGGITTAARSMGIARQNHYDWMELSEDYKEAFEVAQQIYVESFVVEGARRARDGVRRPVFYKDEQRMVHCEKNDPEAIRFEDDNGNVVYKKPYFEVEYSDRLLERFLEAYSPQFKRAANETNVNVGGPTFVMENLLERVEEARRSHLTPDGVLDVVAKRIEQAKEQEQ